MTDPATNLPAAPKPTLHTGAAVAALVPQTLDEAYRLADAMSRSGLTPNGIKSPEAVMVAIMAGAELGLPPFQACQSFAVINGRPSIWGDAIPALLWSNGFKIKEWFENASNEYPDDMTAHCEITRPDGEVIEGEFSVADAKEARLWTKDGPWQTAKKRMLKMRARSYAARDGAADLLRGLYVAEEAQDFTPIGNEPQVIGTGMVERLKSRAAPTDVDPAGFNVRSVVAETEAARPKNTRKAKAPPEAAAPPPPEPEPETIVEAEVEELVRPDAAQAAAEALGGDGLPGDLAPPEPEGPEAQDGCAAPGEVYMHPDFDDIDENGRRATFRDGRPFSRSTPKDDILIYAEHSPLAVVQESGGTGASQVEDEGPPEGIIGETWTKIMAATSWLQVKPMLPFILNSDDFAEMEEDEQDALEAKLWGFVETELRGKHRDPVDQAMDITAFRLWSAWMAQKGREGADAIEGTFPALKTENPAWDRLKDDQRATFEKRTYRRVAAARRA